MTDQEIYQQLILLGHNYPDLFLGYMALNYKAGHHLECFQHINTMSELTFMQMHGLICPKWQYVPLKALNTPFMPDAVIANKNFYDIITIQYKFKIYSAMLPYEYHNLMLNYSSHTDVIFIGCESQKILLNQNNIMTTCNKSVPFCHRPPLLNAAANLIDCLNINKYNLGIENYLGYKNQQVSTNWAIEAAKARANLSRISHSPEGELIIKKLLRLPH